MLQLRSNSNKYFFKYYLLIFPIKNKYFTFSQPQLNTHTHTHRDILPNSLCPNLFLSYFWSAHYPFLHYDYVNAILLLNHEVYYNFTSFLYNFLFSLVLLSLLVCLASQEFSLLLSDSPDYPTFLSIHSNTTILFLEFSLPGPSDQLQSSGCSFALLHRFIQESPSNIILKIFFTSQLG